MNFNIESLNAVVNFLVIIAALLVSFLLGNYLQSQQNQSFIAQLYDAITIRDNILTSKELELERMNAQVNEQMQLRENEQSEMQRLESEVLGLNNEITDLSKELHSNVAKSSADYPFAVPTTGTVATFAGTYGGNMMGLEHWGIDIWTTLENNGRTANNRGNPVYSVCDGRVTRILPGNGAFRVRCDDIQGDFHLPAKFGVFVYYGHLGNAETGELYFNLNVGQRVSKGELLGYQGNLSDVFPASRNVHLHLTIYSGRYQPLAETGGPHNPCLYFGGDCSVPGSRFVAD